MRTKIRKAEELQTDDTIRLPVYVGRTWFVKRVIVDRSPGTLLLGLVRVVNGERIDRVLKVSTSTDVEVIR